MGLEIKELIMDYFNSLWPVIIIITVIYASLRSAYLIKTKEKICFYKELFMLIFIIYVMCLFEVVTISDNNYGLSNFIPFKEIFRYEIGSRLFIKNIIGNILLFVPYGYFVSDHLRAKNFFTVAFLTLIVSITIEVVQLNIGRTFDIDDCILNTCGGILGYFIYDILNKIKNKLPKVFKSEGFINLFVILAIILIIVYLFGHPVITWVIP